MTRRKLLHLAGATLALSATPRLAFAQQRWPTKPIRAIIPFSVGSTIDVKARIVLERVSAQIGQSIVIENRGGAGGTQSARPWSRAPSRMDTPS